MIRVYTASQLKHAAKWRDLCAGNSRVYFHARWLKHISVGTPDTAEFASEFWLQDEQDVKDSDAVLIYAEQGDRLRGALVEAGMAIAYRVPVILAGEHPDFGTWQHHPGVTCVDDLDSALTYLESIKPRYHRN